MRERERPRGFIIIQHSTVSYTGIIPEGSKLQRKSCKQPMMVDGWTYGGVVLSWLQNDSWQKQIFRSASPCLRWREGRRDQLEPHKVMSLPSTWQATICAMQNLWGVNLEEAERRFLDGPGLDPRYNTYYMTISQTHFKCCLRSVYYNSGIWQTLLIQSDLQ